MKIEYEAIGVIHTPFTDPRGMPIQPAAAKGIEGTVEIREPFRDGLADLEGFSHVILIYHFHRSRGHELRVVPFLDSQPRGLFATRAPRRPNPIGLSVVRLAADRGGRAPRARTWTCWTARRCSTSSPTCRSSTARRMCGSAGWSRRGDRCPGADRTTGSGRGRARASRRGFALFVLREGVLADSECCGTGIPR